MTLEYSNVPLGVRPEFPERHARFCAAAIGVFQCRNFNFARTRKTRVTITRARRADSLRKNVRFSGAAALVLFELGDLLETALVPAPFELGAQPDADQVVDITLA